MKKLINSYKKCGYTSKNYRVVWKVEFAVDNRDYLFSILPTVFWQPFPFRYPNTYVFDITWLHFHIGVGLWKRKEA